MRGTARSDCPRVDSQPSVMLDCWGSPCPCGRQSGLRPTAATSWPTGLRRCCGSGHPDVGSAAEGVRPVVGSSLDAQESDRNGKEVSHAWTGWYWTSRERTDERWSTWMVQPVQPLVRWGGLLWSTLHKAAVSHGRWLSVQGISLCCTVLAPPIGSRTKRERPERSRQGTQIRVTATS